MIRIGILSTAHGHAQSYASCLQTIADVEVAGVADEDSTRGHAFAERFGIRMFDSADALLAEGLDGVIICSANRHHRSLTSSRRAIRAIFCVRSQLPQPWPMPRQ